MLLVRGRSHVMRCVYVGRVDETNGFETKMVALIEYVKVRKK